MLGMLTKEPLANLKQKKIFAKMLQLFIIDHIY